jgi:hypothetical protein
MHMLVTPVPLRRTICGLLSASSAIESVPLALPKALGLKVTSIVQLAPDARLEPLQVSVSPKPAPAAILMIVNVVVP